MATAQPETEAARASRGRRKAARSLVDCDVHTTMARDDTLRTYLPERWRRHYELFGGNAYHGGRYPRAVPNAARWDAWPPTGGAPGSDLDFTRLQLLDRWDVEAAILCPLVRGQSAYRNGEFAGAVAGAVNRWTVDEWLDPEPRLRGSIVVPVEHPEIAAEEIDRCASDARFVQVYFQIQTAQPLGQRHYWPIYEAAERNGLPVGIHFGGYGGLAPTGAGWPSYYLEVHVGSTQCFQAQLISLVCEGVFEHFPGLRVVLLEGGIAWLPPLAWRLDRAFERLHEEVPHLKRRPSEYVADHVWLTTQPIEEPPSPPTVNRVLESFPSLEDHLMFSSDYPHWDFDAPDEAFRKIRLAPEVEEKIMHLNARALYRLEGAAT